MKTVLLSIKPEYAKAILTGHKTWELRRRVWAAQDPYLLLYATKPVGKVLGACEVESVERCKLDELWELTKRTNFVTRKQFDLYFQRLTSGYGIKLKRPGFFITPMTLADLGVKRAPVSFCYVNDYIPF